MAQGNPTSDFINDLPRNVLDCILERLPICDLVRTSILSRKWRYHWTTIPNLVFDLRFFDHIMAHDKAMNIVNRLLLLHSGPILKFVLHISSLYSENSTCSIDIDPWILFLSRNGIKELTLCNLGSISHKLPSSIFSCQGLTHLKLSMGEICTNTSIQGLSKYH
ncbi:hypothetical protein L1049_007132 [Liquidambar formosana]|uniref:F-box domain-containing protein n=1 Tax=Liquidambar formosana TaxID=63359 RepID=A0AAP0RGT6_LIQFO